MRPKTPSPLYLCLAALMLSACSAAPKVTTATAANNTSGSYRVHPELLIPAKNGPAGLAVDKDGLRTQRSIYFIPKSAQISQEGSVILANHARYINATPGVKLHVIGFADDAGSPESNGDLAKARAEMAQQELSNIGVKNQRIASVTGKAMQLNEGDKSWPGNRRVDLIYEEAPAAEKR